MKRLLKPAALIGLGLILGAGTIIGWYVWGSWEAKR